MLYNGTNVSVQYQQTRTVCFQNESDPYFKIQEHVQQVTTEKLLSLTLSNSIPVIFTVILVGAYVDYLGRKTIFIVAICGHFSRNLCLAVVIYWHLDTDYLFIGYGIDACCGGFCAFLLVTYAFVADHTARSKSRTFIMGVLTLCIGLANTFGFVITGYFIQNVGYFYPMVTSVSSTLVGLLIALCCVSETLADRPKTFVSPFIGIQNVFRFYYHKDYAGQRHLFWLASSGFFFLMIGPLVSGQTIDTLYELNAPFCWDPIKIGWYSTATMGLLSLVGLGFLRVMQKRFSDGTIALLGVVSIGAREIYISFCDSDMMLYFAPVIGMLFFGSMAVNRSVISQMVPKDRQGCVFASLAFVEALMYASGGPPFNLIYKATVDYYRGAVYIVMGAIHVLDFFIFL
ncbi:hypothetical protein LOTGIDRAFT_115777 [Lottia gigantea]|uniref:Major facilitator superfamily (MFS) profile domain-containing protein n=1 Tax=Lottia gigantea TaxID=225164 RepID=V4ANT7_LOTGI|nr:hypothetical protein LOTGIDRAFT_115777 [Lottia gigantea]ESO96430.1 hypothetical protein LOTGIDRAFT_115777 [Lottia gigantea]